MKRLILAIAILVLGLGLNSCLSELSEKEKMEIAIDEATQQVEDMNTDFYSQYKGGTPEEVLDARYAEMVKQYGEPSEYDSGLNADGSPNMGHSDIIAKQLNLDYAKLVYVQISGGTYGLQTILETMDQSDPSVEETTEAFQNYHSITAYDEDYIYSLMPEQLSTEETSAFILETIADQYRLFYENYRSLWISNPDMVDQVAAVTGLSQDDLMMVFAFGNIQNFVNLLPDEVSYKGELAELVDY